MALCRQQDEEEIKENSFIHRQLFSLVDDLKRLTMYLKLLSQMALRSIGLELSNRRLWQTTVKVMKISADRMFKRNSENGLKQKLRGLEFEDFVGLDDDVAVIRELTDADIIPF